MVVVNPLSIDGAASNEREYAFPVAIGVGHDNARAISTDREAGHAPAVPVRSGMGQEHKNALSVMLQLRHHAQKASVL